MTISPKAFPFLLCALYLGAAITYWYYGDYRRMCYWLFALGINLSVTL
jgi:hypothetical protein